MKIYILHTNDRISSTTFFSKKDLAQNELRKRRDEIIRRCVNVIEDTDDKFSFYFGWEGHHVTWRVSELEVLES